MTPTTTVMDGKDTRTGKLRNNSLALKGRRRAVSVRQWEAAQESMLREI